MSRTSVALMTVVVVVSAPSPAAGFDLGLGLFKKKPKPDPKPRAKPFAAVLLADHDEAKRLAAADALRGLDPRTDPDVIPALVSAVRNDPSPAVRARAAEAIGQLKPVYQPAGLALEAAQGSDPTPAVRDAARDALWQYHLNGYRSAAAAAVPPQTAEPPLAKPAPSPPPTDALTTGRGQAPAAVPVPMPAPAVPAALPAVGPIPTVAVPPAP